MRLAPGGGVDGEALRSTDRSPAASVLPVYLVFSGAGDGTVIRVLNWPEFQHYHQRRPPWVKLYRTLLEKREWYALTGDASKLLVECWLLAAEYDDGAIPMDAAGLAWRLRRPDVRGVHVLLQEIAVQDFIEYDGVDASTMLAPCKQLAITETETETETEESIGASPWPAKPRKRSGAYEYPPEFEDIWSAYPSRAGSNPKVGAYRAVRARIASGDDPEQLQRAATHYAQHCRAEQKDGSQFVQQARTFFGPQETWRDYLDPSSSNGAPPRLPSPYGDETQRDMDRASEARLRQARDEADRMREADEKAERETAELWAWWEKQDQETRAKVEAYAKGRCQGLPPGMRRAVLLGVMAEYRKREAAA